ncbi:MAG: N-glycosylase/DNA lyase [Candidatus Omnitrophica bacterium]|nr:N-glycosylase/DNA lyase [Candidatus Omnitrophota bacterium]
MKDLLNEYRLKRPDIRKRLAEFRQVYKRSDKDIFAELCFCIFTPQAKAVLCDSAIKRLKAEGLLLKGTSSDIRPCLSGVRFPNNKARYLIEARGFFKNRKGLSVKDKIDLSDLQKTRDWLVKYVKGMGYKEASHFLRNIGFGRDMAILDRHVLKNLKRYGVIKKIPDVLSRKEYLKIEKKMKDFFKRLNIPMEEVDLLFWSRETGMIFK